MKLKPLAILTSVLFLISIIVFINENKRGTDLLLGSDYIKGLDVEKIKEIIVIPKDASKISFMRDGAKFLLRDHKSYPASSAKVNELIYKIASIQVKEKIAGGAGDDMLKKFELDSTSRKYLIEIIDNDGKKTVSFSVGRSSKGRGYYLFSEKSGDIYLSKSDFTISSSHQGYINKTFLGLKKDSISEVIIQEKSIIKLVSNGARFIMDSPKGKKIKEDKISEYMDNFSSISFEDYYEHNSPQVQSLRFGQGVDVHLKNKLVYKMRLAKKGDDCFIKASAHATNIPKQIVVGKEDGDEKLKNVEDIINAQKEYQRFNEERASWVYKINRSTYDNLLKGLSFFL